MRSDRTVTERKVPGLHRIPYLGNLFKSKGTTTTKRNMMIIVEAQIITPAGRTYYKDNEPDDAEPREGGTNRSPGQTSDPSRAGTVDSALGLTHRELGPPPAPLAASRSQSVPATAKEGEQPRAKSGEPGGKSPETRRPVPVSPNPAVAVTEALGPDAPRPQQSVAQERMERLARAGRSVARPAVLAPGWARPEEETGDAPAAPPAKRGQVVKPPND
jgi:hypothetical protein